MDNQTINMPVELYTDGSAVRNPGAAGLGYVIRYYTPPTTPGGVPEPNIIEGQQGFRLSTNNRMELMAGIYALRDVIDRFMTNKIPEFSQINMFTDSQYFANAVNQHWIDKWIQNNWMTSGFRSTPKPVKNRDLWEQFINEHNKLRGLGINLTIKYIEGHANHEWNERADKLATSASADTTNHIPDEVYEKTTNIMNRR